MKVWPIKETSKNLYAKAMEIVETRKISKDGKHWLVSSQSHNKNYIVILSQKEEYCTCPDFERRHKTCKHIAAARIVSKKDVIPKDGLDVKVPEKTYPQDWVNYDKAQTREKELFMKLLYDLLQTIEEKERDTSEKGRKPLSVREMAFGSALKVYTEFSLRRFMTDMRYAEKLGYVNYVPHYTLISVYMKKPEMTQLLQKLITLSTLPLRNIETKFSVDSTGFTISRFTDYANEKHNTKREHEWIKASIIIGDITNVVTAIEISDQYSADSNYFRPLVKKTHDNGFAIEEVSADKAYSSRDNIEYVDSLGGMAYIPFKSNTSGKARGSLIWKKMYDYYMLQREDFMDHYHKRSNVETTNFMIKSKLDDRVRSKNTFAQYNEILLKILCHNIVVLIQSMFELGIEPKFFDL